MNTKKIITFALVSLVLVSCNKKTEISDAEAETMLPIISFLGNELELLEPSALRTSVSLSEDMYVREVFDGYCLKSTAIIAGAILCRKDSATAAKNWNGRELILDLNEQLQITVVQYQNKVKFDIVSQCNECAKEANTLEKVLVSMEHKFNRMMKQGAVGSFIERLGSEYSVTGTYDGERISLSVNKKKPAYPVYFV